jgi:fructose-1,6-bisphosphatase/inositol monophosphatase family enzyme
VRLVRTEEILQLLQDVADEVINPRFRTLTEDQVAEKNPGDLVTVADREAEVRITEALERAYPDALVLGEEASASDDTLLTRFRDADHAFTVDPVDGTKNFVAGSPDHAVMAAELRDGEVVRSWVWQPQHGRAYVAERGLGARCNGVRLSRPPVEATPRGVTSRRQWLGRSLDGLAPLELTWVCCGVDYPQLVGGGADYLLYARALPWDHAPGALLLTESGGHLGRFDGGPYRPQDESTVGLVAAADRATYDRVQGLVGELPQ